MMRLPPPFLLCAAPRALTGKAFAAAAGLGSGLWTSRRLTAFAPPPGRRWGTTGSPAPWRSRVHRRRWRTVCWLAHRRILSPHGHPLPYTATHSLIRVWPSWPAILAGSTPATGLPSSSRSSRPDHAGFARGSASASSCGRGHGCHLSAGAAEAAMTAVPFAWPPSGRRAHAVAMCGYAALR